jgi:hypothetical protein
MEEVLQLSYKEISKVVNFDWQDSNLYFLLTLIVMIPTFHFVLLACMHAGLDHSSLHLTFRFQTEAQKLPAIKFHLKFIMLKDNQNANTKKDITSWMLSTWEHNSSVTDVALSPVPLVALMLQQLESAICPIFFVIVSMSCPTKCRLTINIELNNWIKFYTFAIAQYGVVWQLLALVLWSAQAHACFMTAMIELRLLPVTEWLKVPCLDSWLPWPGPLTDWLTVNLTKAGYGFCSCKTRTPRPLPAWVSCFTLNLTQRSFKLQRKLELQLPLPANSLLEQHPLQQVHVLDQVWCCSAGHLSPVRWWLQGQTRQSSWPEAPTNSTSLQCRWRGIREKDDFIGRWYPSQKF